MYTEGVKRLYKYRVRKKRDYKNLLRFTFISIIALSGIIAYDGVTFINQSSNSHYFVNADQNSGSIELKDVQITQNTSEKLFFDEEFYSSEVLGIMDKREFVLEKYLQANESPLAGHAHEFVKACDKYGAPKDCISLVAIAKHETNLCKYYLSAEMRNCLGWGGAGSNRVRFQSFAQMIDRATDVLVNQYGIERMEDPSLMERVFCGPQDECIGWGSRVKNIMNTINNFAEEIGVGKLR